MRICNLLRASGLAGALMITAAFTQRAEGSVIINISQVGLNVVITGSGTINLTALNLLGSAGVTTVLIPSNGVIEAGPLTGSISEYGGAVGPTTFGPGNQTFPSSGSGNLFGIIASDVVVPQGYTSGTSLLGSSTFNNATLASLGITPGTYVWTWGTGATADSLTLNAGTPEPGSLSLMAAGLLLAGLRMRKRRQGQSE